MISFHVQLRQVSVLHYDSEVAGLGFEDGSCVMILLRLLKMAGPIFVCKLDDCPERYWTHWKNIQSQKLAGIWV